MSNNYEKKDTMDMAMEYLDEAIANNEMDEDFFSASLTPQASVSSVESLKEICLGASQQQQSHQAPGKEKSCWAEAARSFEYPIPSPRVSRRCLENQNEIYCGVPVDEDSMTALGKRTQNFTDSIERITEDPKLASKNAVYFWMQDREAKGEECSTGKDAMIGMWEPSLDSLAASVLPGSGITSNIIGSAQKKKKKTKAVRKKGDESFEHFKRYNSVFDVPDLADCEQNDSGRSFTGCLHTSKSI